MHFVVFFHTVKCLLREEDPFSVRMGVSQNIYLVDRVHSVTYLFFHTGLFKTYPPPLPTLNHGLKNDFYFLKIYFNSDGWPYWSDPDRSLHHWNRVAENCVLPYSRVRVKVFHLPWINLVGLFSKHHKFIWSVQAVIGANNVTTLQKSILLMF